jgi:tryptophan halogenase
MKIAIVGGGTAGLIAALCLRQKFPDYEIFIIESSSVGIIGVGEGSTEHWKNFCNFAKIDINELIENTDATHKQGIYFENWTNHTPKYFHSIGQVHLVNGCFPVYEYINENSKLLTNMLAHPEFINNKVVLNDDGSIQGTVNQYHFDTVKLNKYFHSICALRNIKVFDDTVVEVLLDPEDGHVDSVVCDSKTYKADFWIDATGFAQVITKKLKDSKWISASDYLPNDRAIPFPTESDPSGDIRPYTRARAASSGWVWEIPTQQRRGNGYVFSSSHISVEEACDEIFSMTGVQLEDPRVIKFDAGHMDKMWVKNCVSMGLCGSFVEPLEATSISTSIQQSLLLTTFLGTYKRGNIASINRYNKIMDEFHQNLVAMIALHYVSDRRDTEFWRDCSTMKRPDYLQNLLDLWRERPPSISDVSLSGYELFSASHFWHVAQGQGVLPPEVSAMSLDNTGLRQEASDMLGKSRGDILSQKVIPHASLFRKEK